MVQRYAHLSRAHWQETIERLAARKASPPKPQIVQSPLAPQQRRPARDAPDALGRRAIGGGLRRVQARARAGETGGWGVMARPYDTAGRKYPCAGSTSREARGK